MQMKFLVANVKCAGCAATIREGLMALPEVSQVTVEVSSGEVEVVGAALVRASLGAKLAELGYPVIEN